MSDKIPPSEGRWYFYGTPDPVLYPYQENGRLIRKNKKTTEDMENGSDREYDTLKEPESISQTQLQVCKNDETTKQDDAFS